MVNYRSGDTVRLQQDHRVQLASGFHMTLRRGTCGKIVGDKVVFLQGNDLEFCMDLNEQTQGLVGHSL